MSRVPERRHYAAIFFLSFSILMLEITVARILSVALLSHYAFVAISLAMFGLGLSGLVVYLMPSKFTASAVDKQLIIFSSLFGLSAAVSVLFFLHIQVIQELSIMGFITLSLVYGILAIPFFMGGVCISLLMTHFSVQIARIYYADLLGASLGCLGVVAAMTFAPAPQVSVLVATIITAGTLALALKLQPRHWVIPSLSFVVTALLLLSAFTTDLYTMRYIKWRTGFYADYEAWNAFSRVSAWVEARNAAQNLPLKGPSEDYADDSYPETMILDIDGTAWTPMMNFNGDFSSIEFLRESVLYLVHHLKPNAKTLVIGVGGGRDILAAALFKQPEILGIELNPLMKEIVDDHYGHYSGHIYSMEGVDTIIDEARSRLSLLDRKYDIIQLSLIDTFSLNAAGGMVFSENYLYTMEGFQEYFRHLTPNGVLCLARYFAPKYPLEILRLGTLARAAWEAEGVTNFKDCVISAKQGVNATMLVKRSPFTQEELERFHQVAEENNMEVLYSPDALDTGNPDLVSLFSAPKWQTFADNYEFMIDPPTDNRPFFFNFLRGLIDVPSDKLDPFRFLRQWNDALMLMYMLIGVLVTMAFLFFIVPLLIFGRQQTHHVQAVVAAPLLLYFACLGYGFMMIEIPLMQQLVLFLGYPVYALAIVLFALLLFTGIGSLISARFSANTKGSLTSILLLIVILALAYTFAVPSLISALLPMPVTVKILVTVALLAPIGIVLGMAYPLGITLLRGFGGELVPWAWGLNGAMSVVASVLATFLGNRYGFSNVFFTAAVAYGLALVLILAATSLSRDVQGAGAIQNDEPA